MSDDSFEIWRRALEARDELAGIRDPELDQIRDRMKAELVRSLRAGIDEINGLPEHSKRGLSARRRAEIEWPGAVLEALSAPQ
jgi:hypothetical protein